MTYRMDGVLFMAEKKLKRWELALIFGVVFALLWGFWVDEEQQELADQVIRFHVLANSDSPEDQELKLKVRDEVLACAQSVYPENADLEQARQALTAHLEDLAQAGQSVASVLSDGSISGCLSIRSNYHQGNIYKDNFWDVWNRRFQVYRDAEWKRTGICRDCSLFADCQGNGMHLRDDDGNLALCHYRKLHDEG